jgi:alpha-beta hydrolase superfamily lysophospholipase
MSSMESPKFRMLADALGAAGMAALRFDFRGCGASEGELAETTVSGRVADLESVLLHLRRSLGHTGPVGLLGSSMGGYVALLAFSQRSDVGAICVLASPFDLKSLVGFRDHPDLSPLGPGFFADLERHDLASSSRGLHHLLILHGERDEVIPASQARRLYEAASEPKELFVFPGGDHRFSDPAQRVEAAERCLRWFQRHLSISRP